SDRPPPSRCAEDKPKFARAVSFDNEDFRRTAPRFQKILDMISGHTIPAWKIYRYHSLRTCQQTNRARVSSISTFGYVSWMTGRSRKTQAPTRGGGGGRAWITSTVDIVTGKRNCTCNR